MSDQNKDQSLTLGDRVNFPFILANYLLKFGEVIVQPEGAQSEQQVREAALVLFNSMPDAWIVKDIQFKHDLKNAITTRTIDARTVWCGRRVGPKKEEDIEEVQPYRLYNAVINVFQRRGLLSKAIYSENIVPTPETLEEQEAENEVVADSDLEELNRIKHIVNQPQR